mgnify:CR=1 FL=1
MIKPLGDRVLIEKDKVKDTTEGGIALPAKSIEDTESFTGMVRAIGRDVEDINVGCRVIYQKYAGTEFRNDYRIVKQADVIAAFTEDE